MKPKKRYNEDHSIDYIFDATDFEQNYMVGCMINRTEKEVTVRVNGRVADLAHVVMKYEKKIIHEPKNFQKIEVNP